MEYTMTDKMIEKVLELFEEGKSLSYVAALYPEYSKEVKSLHATFRELRVLKSEAKVIVPREVLQRIVDNLPEESIVVAEPQKVAVRFEWAREVLVQYRSLASVWKFGAPIGVALVVVLLFAQGGIEPGTVIQDETLDPYAVSNINADLSVETLDTSIPEAPALRMTSDASKDTSPTTALKNAEYARQKGVEVNVTPDQNTNQGAATPSAAPATMMAVTTSVDETIPPVDEIFASMNKDMRAEEVSNVEGDTEVVIISDDGEELDLIVQSYNETNF
jgi:hypothetical protein